MRCVSSEDFWGLKRHYWFETECILWVMLRLDVYQNWWVLIRIYHYDSNGMLRGFMRDCCIRIQDFRLDNTCLIRNVSDHFSWDMYLMRKCLFMDSWEFIGIHRYDCIHTLKWMMRYWDSRVLIRQYMSNLYGN